MRSARGRRSFHAWHWLAYTEPIEVMALSGMAAVVVLLPWLFAQGFGEPRP